MDHVSFQPVALDAFLSIAPDKPELSLGAPGPVGCLGVIPPALCTQLRWLVFSFSRVQLCFFWALHQLRAVPGQTCLSSTPLLSLPTWPTESPLPHPSPHQRAYFNFPRTLYFVFIHI